MNFNWGVIIPVIISLITGGYAYLTARNSNKTTLQKATKEEKVDMSVTNNTQSLALFQQYQQLNESLQLKFDKMQEKLETIQEEFRVFRVDTDKEKAFLNNKIENLEEDNEELLERVEVLEIENRDLVKKVDTLTTENTRLKGEILT